VSARGGGVLQRLPAGGVNIGTYLYDIVHSMLPPGLGMGLMCHSTVESDW
jgi:hypothetical protein